MWARMIHVEGQDCEHFDKDQETLHSSQDLISCHTSSLSVRSSVSLAHRPHKLGIRVSKTNACTEFAFTKKLQSPKSKQLS